MVDHELPAGLHPRRLTHLQLGLLDSAAALAYLVFGLPVADSSATTPGVVEAAVVAGIAAPVAVRRLWPRPALAVVLVSSLTGIALGYVTGPLLATTLVVYTVALTEPQRSWVPTRTLGVIGGVVVVFAAVSGPVGWQWGAAATVVLGTALVAGAWALGRAVRDRRDYTERAAEQLARHAVTQERVRIARELHDVVAHSMSVITVKAGIAHHVMRTHPEKAAEAADALGVIEITGRSALTEMRHLLGVLRSEDDGAQAPDLGPSPGIADLEALAGRVSEAGVAVDLLVDVENELPEGVALSVYRIAQEAVTNVVKHAAAANCRLHVRGVDTTVTVEVVDDGAGRRDAPGCARHRGHGLVGMYERVATYGGTFSAAPRAGGGFAVHASLPYSPVASMPKPG